MHDTLAQLVVVGSTTICVIKIGARLLEKDMVGLELEIYILPLCAKDSDN